MPVMKTRLFVASLALCGLGFGRVESAGAQVPTHKLPTAHLKMDLHVGFSPESASVIDVEFTPIGEEQTQVDRTQSNWEALGDVAEMMHETYESRWDRIFEQEYESACDREWPRCVPRDGLVRPADQ